MHAALSASSFPSLERIEVAGAWFRMEMMRVRPPPITLSHSGGGDGESLGLSTVARLPHQGNGRAGNKLALFGSPCLLHSIYGHLWRHSYLPGFNSQRNYRQLSKF